MTNLDKTQVEAAVLRILSTVIKQPLPHGAATTMENTVGWDSLKHIEIMFAVEEELNIQFSEEELAELRSVAQIVAAIAAHHAA